MYVGAIDTLMFQQADSEAGADEPHIHHRLDVVPDEEM